MTIKILVVDDEELLLRSLAGALRNDGFAVTGVSNGEEALDQARSGDFNVCFLDVQLPDANGIELIPALRQASPLMRIVVMTALDLAEEQLARLRWFSCGFLPKPFSLEHVRSLVQTP